MLTTSAPSRLPASSNEVRVRVELSKNRLIWVSPRISAELLVGLPAVGDVGVGAIQQMLDLPGRQPLDAEQMALGEGRGNSATVAIGRNYAARAVRLQVRHGDRAGGVTAAFMRDPADAGPPAPTLPRKGGGRHRRPSRRVVLR